VFLSVPEVFTCDGTDINSMCSFELSLIRSGCLGRFYYLSRKDLEERVGNCVSHFESVYCLM